MGISEVQRHQFHCLSCKEALEVTVEIGKGIIFGQNCVRVAANAEATPIYLSSDFVAAEGAVHDRFSFPSMEFMGQLAEKFDQSSYGSGSGTSPRPEALWGDLQKAWRLEDAKQYHLANPIIDKFCAEHDVEPSNLDSAQFMFLGSIKAPDEEVLGELEAINKANGEEFGRFLHYYQIHLREHHRHDFFIILGEFFKTFSEFSQVFLYIQAGLELPNDARATSVDFEMVKKFYADCYEFFAGAVCIYTALNNIKSGRPFDQLSQISFAKYLTTDKADRRKNFETNVGFSKATAEFNSMIRNASFHNWFRLKDNKTEIEFRSGGTGALQTISYASYLYKCVHLFVQTCTLFQVELVLDEAAKNRALVTRRPM